MSPPLKLIKSYFVKDDKLHLLKGFIFVKHVNFAKLSWHVKPF